MTFATHGTVGLEVVDATELGAAAERVTVQAVQVQLAARILAAHGQDATAAAGLVAEALQLLAETEARLSEYAAEVARIGRDAPRTGGSA